MAIRDVPGYGLYILVYEGFLMHLKDWKIADKHGAFASIVSGGLAGVISWLVMAPTDVVKSLIQADVSNKYRGIMHCVLHTYRNHGIKAFYAGCTVNCMRAFPVNAITFLVYSQILRELERRPQSKDDGTCTPADVDGASFHPHVHYLFSVGAFEFDPQHDRDSHS